MPFQAALFGRQPVLVPAGRGHLVQAGQEEEVQAAAVDGATDGRRRKMWRKTVQNGDWWTERERGQLEFDDDDSPGQKKKEGGTQIGFQRTKQEETNHSAKPIVLLFIRNEDDWTKKGGRDPEEGLKQEDWREKEREREKSYNNPLRRRRLSKRRGSICCWLWTCQKITNFVCRSCKDFVFHLEIVCHKMMIILRCEKKGRIPRPEEEGKEGRRRKTEVITPTIRMWRREDSGPPKGSDGGTRAPITSQYNNYGT